MPRSAKAPTIERHATTRLSASSPPSLSSLKTKPTPRAASLAWLDRPAGTWLAALLLIGAGLLAYANTFSVPLLLDDPFAISENPSIRQLWPLGPVLSPPITLPTGGRPLLNLSFAANYAVGQASVAGYHAVNLAIHLLAGLALFGVLRRTFALPALRGRFAPHGPLLALVIAALWLLHPLQTAAVTYLSQRAESLMGLCYLATLYCVIRSCRLPPQNPSLHPPARPGETGPGQISAASSAFSSSSSAAPSSSAWRWSIAAVAICACGMATKEVMATAPLAVLLYDRCFLAGSFRTALRARRPLYLGLAATWPLLAALVITSRLQDRDIGYGGHFTAWTYLVTESRVVLDYLRLSLWPSPLVFDYGPVGLTPGPARAVVSFALLAAFFGASLAGLVRGRTWGFVGLWFFLILAPTSTLIPIKFQPMAESRLYLPLAGVLTALVLGAYLALSRRVIVFAGTAALALLGGFATFQRNTTYATELSLWTDTLAQHPTSSRAHNSFATAILADSARWPEAIEHYEEALRLQPDYPEAESNLANLLSVLPGRLADSLIHHEHAIRAQPRVAGVYNNYGNALARVPGREAEAIPQFETALRLDPNFGAAHASLADLLRATPGRRAEAIAHFEAALRTQPNNAVTQNNFANALRATPDGLPAALPHYEAALRLRPSFFEARYNYGLTLLQLNRLAEARPQLQAALQLRPDFDPARQILSRLDALESARPRP